MNTLTSLATRASLLLQLSSLVACGGGSSLAPGVSADPPATPPPLAADAPALALTLQSAKTFLVKASDNLVGAIGFGKADTPASGDAFGHSVAVSDDGGTLAVGAPGESSSGGGWQPTRDNLSELAGAVYLY